MCVFCGLNTKSYLWVFCIGHVFCLSVAMDGDLICYSDASLALFEDLIHLLLEDVLGTDQAKGKLQEMVSSEGTVESHEQAGLLVKDD